MHQDGYVTVADTASRLLAAKLVLRDTSFARIAQRAINTVSSAGILSDRGCVQAGESEFGYPKPSSDNCFVKLTGATLSER